MPPHKVNHQPKYVQAFRAKGKIYYYFRDRKVGRRVALRGDPSTPEFHEHYAELLRAEHPRPQRPANGTLAAVIAAYRASKKFEKLAPRTKVSYEACLQRLKLIEHFPVSIIKTSHIEALRDQIAGPRAADLFVRVAHIVFRRAVRDDFITKNPAKDIEELSESESYKAWTDRQCEKFVQAYRDGKVPTWAMTAYMLGRYIGQRRGDLLNLPWGAYDGSTITLRQSKTKKTNKEDLVIPVHRDLKTYLDGLSRESLLMIPTPTGRKWMESNFSRAFRKALDEIGLQGLHLHGLRHYVGSALANAGASPHMIMAILGHATLAMAKRYTDQADKKRMASMGIAMLEKDEKRKE